jgi:hypothetical protein
MAEKKKKNPKLKVGDKVYVRMLGARELAVVIEITDKRKSVYKVKLGRGTVLPSIKWINEKEKNKPFWYIEELYEN